MRPLDRKTELFVYLSAIFVASLLLGDLIGGKAFAIHMPFGAWAYDQPVSVGLFAFPVTFLLTDIVNEFYGQRGARFLTFLGMWMAIFAFVILNVSQWPHAEPHSYLADPEFNRVFGVGGSLFIASIVAYLCGQFLDIYVFQFWKGFTQSKHLWLRATGSTLASQVIDTFVINILFWWAIPQLTHNSPRGLDWVSKKAVGEYVIKFFIAVLLTPAVYALHELVVRKFRIEPEPHAPTESDVATATASATKP